MTTEQIRGFRDQLRDMFRMQSEGKINEALFLAIELDQAEVVRALVEKGANVNATHKGNPADRDDQTEGLTPLQFATWHGHAEIARTLIEKGARVKTYVEEGRKAGASHRFTALHYAAWHGHADVVRLLLEKGANIEAAVKAGSTKWPTSLGYTALHLASGAGYAEVVRTLLENGANVNAINSNGETPLHGAARGDQAEVVRVLLENGADVNATDERGWTALEHATYKAGAQTVRALVEKGADVSSIKVLQTIMQNMHRGQVGRILLEAGAKVTAAERQEILSFREHRHVDIWLDLGDGHKLAQAIRDFPHNTR